MSVGHHRVIAVRISHSLHSSFPFCKLKMLLLYIINTLLSMLLVIKLSHTLPRNINRYYIYSNLYIIYLTLLMVMHKRGEFFNIKKACGCPHAFCFLFCPVRQTLILRGKGRSFGRSRIHIRQARQKTALYTKINQRDRNAQYPVRDTSGRKDTR